MNLKGITGSARFWMAALAVALVQTVILGFMVWDRISLLQNGREVTLDVRPVDPRSLFRGDYVILDYGEISRLPLEKIEGEKPAGSGPSYVTLKKDGAGEWQPVAVGAQYPQKAGADELVLRGRVKRTSGKFAHIQYGIESYFVPEGTGRELEKLIGKGQLKVVVAVARSGKTAIKGIVVDGKRIYDEPLL